MKSSWYLNVVLCSVTALAPLYASAAGDISSDIAVIQLVTRQSSTGTNIGRADTESRPLRPDATSDRIRRAVEAAVPCLAQGDFKVKASSLSVRDFIGNSSVHLVGLGLYISTNTATERGYVEGFIAPFISMRIDVTANGNVSQSFEISEHERVPINQTTNLDFVHNNTPALESAILSFAQKTIESNLRKRASALCAQGK